MTDKTAPAAPAVAAVAVLADESQRGGRDTGERELHRHLEISDGDGMVASADVTISRESGGSARASLRAVAGHLAPGVRTRLVDAVLDLPELRHGAHLQAAFPLGDSETLFRFQERCTNVSTHPAGATVLLEATIRPGQPGRAGAPGVDAREAAQRWADAWEHGWREHDATAIAALYADGAFWQQPPFHDPEPGYLARVFAGEEPAEYRFGTPIVDGDRAVVPWSARTRLTGGGTEHLAGVSLLRFSDDGLVLEERDFCNQG